MEIYWEKAVTYEGYFEIISKKEKLEIKQEMKEKYLDSIKRSKFLIKNYIPNRDQIKKRQKKEFIGKILIIAEGWCGDCSQSIPIINQFFSKENQVRIIFRDENQSLMKNFLTNGSEAIPIVIFLDDRYNVISHWGPRTIAGTEILLNHKKSGKFNKSSFLLDLHNYYESNKGFDIIDEILLKI
ncbi:hypothetical protein BBD32_12565 [Elizabethkingia anophelis]|uniref:Thioredoxin family protein n=2 Tax=Elizabethkingia anophelis TaxID=1117645 RepID=A0AAU8VJQ6_9FLAO|nr:hypothetical protein BBD32_12565 [Elizabethkingia anophelis]OPB61480.1 hypothetical protein BAY11_17660 [Elizabethkingia anophelis]